MAQILLTNDDGYQSAGFLPLLRSLSKDHTVTAVAPDREKSWIGKAISTHRELVDHPVTMDGFTIHTLDATPADCVQIGLYSIMKQRPDMVVSGINLGENAGNARILSSGTVGAAIEASFEGLRAVASSFSLPLVKKKTSDLYSPAGYPLFEQAAAITARLVTTFLSAPPLPGVDVVSISIPYEATLASEVVVAKPFKGPYKQLFQTTPLGFVHRTPPLEFSDLKEGTDLKALWEGKVAVTPLDLSMSSAQGVEATRRFLGVR